MMLGDNWMGISVLGSILDMVWVDIHQDIFLLGNIWDTVFEDTRADMFP